MSRSEKNIDYVGKRFGSFIVRQQLAGRRLLCECDCGGFSNQFAASLVTRIPKTHRACVAEIQLELALDSVRTMPYIEAS